MPCGAGEIHDAVRGDDWARVQSLLEQRASLVNSRAEEGATPLHFAAGLNRVEIAKLLLEKGADVNSETTNGSTPLHWAALRDASGVAAVLLVKGADISARTDKSGLTALEIALRKNSMTVAEVIVGAQSRAVLTDPVFLGAIDAWRGGREREAYDAFHSLVMEYPGSEYLNRAVAHTAYSLGRYPHAMAALERILLARPDDISVRVFLARCYFMQHRFDLARKHLEDVLEDTEDRRTVDTVRGYLNVIDRLTRRKGWYFSVATGLMHDSNVNVGPDSDIISIAPVSLDGYLFESLEVGEDSLPVEATGAFVFSSLTVLTEVGRAGRWQWLANGAAYHTFLEGASEYQMFYLGAAAGPRYMRESHLFELPVRLSYLGRGGESLVNIYAFSPAWVAALGRGSKWHVHVRSSFEYRDFTDLDYRDGPYVAAGPGVTRFIGRKGHSVTADMEVQREEADTSSYRNTAVDAGVGARIRLGLGMTTTVAARYRLSRYDKIGSLLEKEKREDSQYRLSAGLTKTMGDGWTVEGRAQVTDNGSTFGLYEYNRWQATLSTTYSF